MSTCFVYVMVPAVLQVGLVSSAVTTELIDGTLTTVLTGFAENQDSLATTFPLIFHRWVRITEYSSFRNRRLNDEI